MPAYILFSATRHCSSLFPGTAVNIFSIFQKPITMQILVFKTNLEDKQHIGAARKIIE